MLFRCWSFISMYIDDYKGQTNMTRLTECREYILLMHWDSIKTENRMQNCQNRYIFTSQLLKPWPIRHSGDKWSIQSKLN